MKPKMIVPEPIDGPKYTNLRDGELIKVEGATIRCVYNKGVGVIVDQTQTVPSCTDMTETSFFCY